MSVYTLPSKRVKHGPGLPISTVVMGKKYPNKAPSNKELNKKIKRIQSKQEVKHKDTLISTTLVSDPSTAHTILINGYQQGDGSSNRTADKVNFTSVQFRAEILMDTASVVSTFYRIIIFRDIQANGTAPTAAMLLDNSVASAYVHSPYNTDNMQRFKVYYDKRGTLNPLMAAVTNPADGSVDSIIPISRKINFKWKLGFTTNMGLGNAGTIADISTNSLYILFLSNRSIASAIAPSILGCTRVYYKDD